MIILWNKLKGSGGNGGGGGGGGSSSFPTIVTDSGSSLPSASGYQEGDTFLDTSDKKIYKAGEGITGYTLATGVTNTATLDTTTGIVSDFYAEQGIFRRILKSSPLYWGGNLSLNIHFKINEVLASNTYYGIFCLYNSSSGTGKDVLFAIKDKKLYCCMGQYSYGPTTWTYNDILLDYELDFDTEYFLSLKKEGNVLRAELFTDGYDGTQVSSNSIATEDWYISTSSNFIIGGISGGGTLVQYTYINNLLVYLGDTSGEFVVANTGLSWDSGVAIEDKSEIADKTNGILYLYENDELVKIGGSLTKKVYTISADNTSTLDVSSDFAKIVDVLKNGVELAITDDYTISSGVITFVTALSTTDKITVKGE